MGPCLGCEIGQWCSIQRGYSFITQIHDQSAWLVINTDRLQNKRIALKRREDRYTFKLLFNTIYSFFFLENEINQSSKIHIFLPGNSFSCFLLFFIVFRFIQIFFLRFRLFCASLENKVSFYTYEILFQKRSEYLYLWNTIPKIKWTSILMKYYSILSL